MQWSKLKTRIQSLICPELRSRIDFHLTSYRKSHDGADKVWITVDGQRIFSFDHYPFERAEASAYYSGLSTEETKNLLQEREIQRPKDFGDAMREYLDTPIRRALDSENPIIRAFAMIDRRTGRRTTSNLQVDESEHTLVKAFYELRKSSQNDQN